jgi:hypothetical protein
MLSQSSKINYSTALQSAEDISFLGEYGINQDTAPPSFPALKNDNSNQEEEHSSKTNKKETKHQENPSTDLQKLLPRQNFSELFNRFFVAGHKQILTIQSKIRMEKGIQEGPLLTLSALNAHKIQMLREHYYQLQMSLFKSPKGNQHDSIL